jgi:hypothetical protein
MMVEIDIKGSKADKLLARKMVVNSDRKIEILTYRDI